MQKVRLAEDGWNSRDADKVSLAYSLDTQWRNRAEFTNGREEARQFLARKWNKELEYRLIKELWAFTENRIGSLRVRMARRLRQLVPFLWQRKLGIRRGWPDAAPLLVHQRPADQESDRKFHWPLGRRPDDHPGLSDLGM